MSDLQNDTLIFSENVLLSADTRPVSALITIRGSEISAVHEIERAQLNSTPSEPRQALDLGRLWITPAFVNAHTHLAMSALRGLVALSDFRSNVVTDFFFRAESRLTAADVRAFARMGAYESLLGGVAVVWDHYYFGQAIADALLDVGLAGVVAPTLQDLTGPGSRHFEAQLEATERIHKSIKYEEAGIFAAVGPHATDTVSLGLWQSARDLAARLNVPLHAHVAQSLTEYQLIDEREGCSPLTWLVRHGLLDVPRAVLAHCLFADRSDLRLLEPQTHVLAVCPYSQAKFGFVAPVDKWQALGLNWVVGTDCAPSNDTMNLQQELRVLDDAALVGLSALPAAAAFFDKGNVEGAQALDALREQAVSSKNGGTPLVSRLWQPHTLCPAFRTGEIAPGARAHLCIWDPDHPSLWPAADVSRALCQSNATAALHGLMVNGRFVGTLGDFATSIVRSAEYQAARKEAESRWRVLRRAIGA